MGPFNGDSTDEMSRLLKGFIDWLDSYGETSWDYQSFFAGPVGGQAKSLYYQHGLIGTAAVAPMIFCEAFLPGARRLFHHRIRFPIADAHYAMGFAFLYEATGDSTQLEPVRSTIQDQQHFASCEIGSLLDDDPEDVPAVGESMPDR